VDYILSNKSAMETNFPGKIKAPPLYSFEPKLKEHTEHAVGSKSEVSLPFFFTYKAVSPYVESP